MKGGVHLSIVLYVVSCINAATAPSSLRGIGGIAIFDGSTACTTSDRGRQRREHGALGFCCSPKTFHGLGGFKALRTNTRTGMRHVALNLHCGMEFHEAQQSRQYNIAKAQGGYYSHDEHGEVDDHFDKVMEKRMRRATFLESQETLVDKYMPSLDPSDPIVMALMSVCEAKDVTNFELLDKRWNGNEVMKYTTDVGDFFVKMNRIEDKGLLLSEAMSLTSMERTKTIRVPKPLHVGELPKVGDVGPGSFLIAEYLRLVPFGAMKPVTMHELGDKLADMHLSTKHDAVHKGRYGFVADNFLSRTPVVNEWESEWQVFFAKRLRGQLDFAFVDKPYSKGLAPDDDEFRDLGKKVVSAVPGIFQGASIRPSLVHGDLWIGNIGATAEGAVVFDPACFFGHSEFDLAITGMFGGYTQQFYDAYHAKVPKAEGFERRERVYQLFHFVNQFNLFSDKQVRGKCIEIMREIAESP